MKQVWIAARKSDGQRLMAALQQAGVLHLEPLRSDKVKGDTLTTSEREERRQLERLLARCEAALGELKYGGSAGELPSEELWASRVEELASTVESLVQERNNLKTELELANTYSNAVTVAAKIAGTLDTSKRFTLLPFIADADQAARVEAALKEGLQNRFVVSSQNTDNGVVGVVAVFARDRELARAALVRGGVGELRLPGRFESLSLSAAAQELQNVQKTAPNAINTTDAAIGRLHERQAGELLALRNAIHDRAATYQAREWAVSGKYGLVLHGYVPTDREVELQGALRGIQVQFEIADAPEDHHHAAEVPVVLRNQGYTKHMELLLGIFPPPKYGTFDPTWIIGIFFPFFFGFIIADAGYGLMLMWLGFTFAAMARKNQALIIGFLGFNIAPKSLTSLAFIVQWMAGWSIVWGIATGEFFGTLLEHLHVFYIPGHTTGLLPIVFPRLEGEFINTVMLISLAFGVLQVFWGWFIRIRIAAKHNEQKHFWEGIGMVGGLLGLILGSYLFLTKANIPVITIGMYASFGVFLLGVVMSKVPLMLMEIISNGGNLLSYSRLFAVGLASAVLAKMATDAGWGLYESLGIPGAVLGVIVGLLIHAVALLFTIIGHVLQPLRLNYVEFLTKTGFYDEAGRRYVPFQRKNADNI